MKFELKRRNTYEVVFRRANSANKEESKLVLAAETIIDAIKLVRRSNPERWHYYRIEVVGVRLVGTVWGAP